MDITACVVSYFTGAGTTRAVSERFAAAAEAAGVPARGLGHHAAWRGGARLRSG